jgi:pectate lyase
VRFGQVHVVNSLYTSVGNDYCIALGADANVLVENTAFIGVNNPILARKYSTEKSVLVARGNLYTNCSGKVEDKPGAVFTPPYRYIAEPAEKVSASVMAGAGPQRVPLVHP